ncbi:hypothetical protein NDU88_002376 [Pleurodeles waltl]|uniref:Uncharacterized protein n=1 Tax=Pleurodeles waltl TaxID=8319 RepID=A0AAV7T329_PLEWA|nr:hypothetical protein NDU88_002376 [Pleurodeles waltl]
MDGTGKLEKPHCDITLEGRTVGVLAGSGSLLILIEKVTYEAQFEGTMEDLQLEDLKAAGYGEKRIEIIVEEDEDVFVVGEFALAKNEWPEAVENDDQYEELKHLIGNGWRQMRELGKEVMSYTMVKEELIIQGFKILR